MPSVRGLGLLGACMLATTMVRDKQGEQDLPRFGALVEGPAEGPAASSSSDPAVLPFACSKTEQLKIYRDQIKALEQKLRVVQGTCAILNKRDEVAKQCQLYALEEMKSATDALHWIRLDAQAENDRVNAKLNAADAAFAEYPTFWRDRSAASVFVRLQNRISQVQDFFEKCTAALGLVWDVMMPLNQRPPHGLFGLMMEFCNGQRVRSQVRKQLIAGAEATLALALARYPRLDLLEIAAGPPTDADGNNINLEIHCALARDPAEIIADKVVLDSDPEYAQL